MRIELYRNIVSRKRFNIFVEILAVLALGFCPRSNRARAGRMAIRLTPGEFKRLQAG